MSQNSINPKLYVMTLLPALFCYFAMGFVDIVGIGSNYVQKDLNLTNSEANLFPSLLFFWFLLFSIPSSLLMNRIGRRNTVLVSIVVSVVSMIFPLFGDSYPIMLIAFSLLGIGNAIMQTALPPLLSNIVAPEKLSSAMTFGLFIKCIAAFGGPVLCAWGAAQVLPTFGYGWRIVFLIYAVIGVVSYLWLWMTSIPREQSDKVSGLRECLKLLGSGFIFLSFLGIICHVGLDVGINTIAPRIFMERCNMPLEEAGYAISLYFIFRTLGSLVGAITLQKISAKLIFGISALMLAIGFAGCAFLSNEMALYICVAMLGFGNANIFPIIVAQAILRRPEEANEVSGLMIMGLFGGTLFPLVMGFVSDITGSQMGAVVVMLIGALYLVYYTLNIRARNVSA